MKALLFPLFCAGLALADPIGQVDPADLTFHREGDTLQVDVSWNDAHTRRYFFPLRKVKPGTKFYHWAERHRADFYEKTGKLPPETMASLNQVTGKLQSYGPGFYVSLDAFDASIHGDKSVMITAAGDGFYVLDNQITSEILGIQGSEKAKQLYEKLAAEEVLGSKIPQSEWYVLNDARAAADIKPFNGLEYVAEQFRQARNLPPNIDKAFGKVLAGKPIDGDELLAISDQDIARLSYREKENMTYALKEATATILDTYPADNPGRPAARLAQLREMSNWGRGRSEFKTLFPARLALLNKELPLQKDTEKLKLILDQLAKFALQPNFPSPELTSLARTSLSLAREKPELQKAALGLVGLVEAQPLPSRLLRWRAGPDFALTRELAAQIGLPIETAQAFREVLYTQRGYTAPLSPAGRILEKVKISEENALKILKLADRSPMVFSAGLALAQKVENPSKELVSQLLEGLANDNVKARMWTAEVLESIWQNSPALRSESQPLLKEWYARNKGPHFLEEILPKVLEAAGLSKEELTGEPCATGFASLGKNVL